MNATSPPPALGPSAAPARPPALLLAIGLYLLALPYLPARLAALAMLGIVLGFVFRPAQLDPDPGWRFLLPVTGFLASSLLAVLRAPDQVVASIVLSFLLPGLALFTIEARNPHWQPRHWLAAWTGFAAINAASVVAGWFAMLASHPTQAMRSVPEAPLIFAHSQLLLVPNDIVLASLLLPAMLTLALDAKAGRGLRLFAWASMLLSAFAMILLRSRTAMLVAGIELAVIALALRRITLLLLLPLAAIAAWALDHVLGLQLVNKLLGIAGTGSHGVDGRLGLWASAWGMFKTAPVLGHGAQAFAAQHGDYLPAWSPRFPERRAAWAHNLYLETLADQGLAGLLALCALFTKALRQSCVLFVQGLRKGYINTPAVCAFAALIGFLAASGLELTFIRRWVPLVLFGLLGLCRQAASASARAETA